MLLRHKNRKQRQRISQTVKIQCRQDIFSHTDGKIEHWQGKMTGKEISCHFEIIVTQIKEGRKMLFISVIKPNKRMMIQNKSKIDQQKKHCKRRSVF